MSCSDGTGTGTGRTARGMAPRLQSVPMKTATDMMSEPAWQLPTAGAGGSERLRACDSSAETQGRAWSVRVHGEGHLVRETRGTSRAMRDDPVPAGSRQKGAGGSPEASLEPYGTSNRTRRGRCVIGELHCLLRYSGARPLA